MDETLTGAGEFPTPEMAEVYRQYMNLPPSNAAFSDFYDQAIYRIRANVNDDAAWFAILLLTIDALQELSEDAAKHCAKYATDNKFVMHRCGLVMIHQSKLDEACQLARDYLGNEPGEPLAYEILVKALHQSGDRNTMLGVFEEIAANSRRGVRYQNNVALSWSELARLRRHFQIPRKNRTALHRETTLAAQNAAGNLFDLMTQRAITWAPVVGPDGFVTLGGAIVSKEPVERASFLERERETRRRYRRSMPVIGILRPERGSRRIPVNLACRNAYSF